jgi:hypothetical protein
MLRALFQTLFLNRPQRTEARDQLEESEWAPECYAFVDHWHALRIGSALPTTQSFLDHPSPRFSPFVFVLELHGDLPLVRMQGTQLVEAWARDLTGEDFFPGRPDHFKANAVTNMRALLAQPCGYFLRSTYATSKGRKITSDWILLPLAVAEGKPPRIVGGVFERPTRRYDETSLHHFELHRWAWLDTGCSVPRNQPLPLFQ